MISSHGINIVSESWEGASLPMLFLSELMGRHSKSATTSYFWKKLLTFFQLAYSSSAKIRNTVNK